MPMLDDYACKPQTLLAQYAPLGLATYLPWVRALCKYLSLVQELSGIMRLHLGMHVGRKTFATLKIYQGVPRSQVLMATGHQMEANFNCYLGIDEMELMKSYRRTTRKVGHKMVENQCKTWPSVADGVLQIVLLQ
jgi:hypothetical protein